MPPRPVHALFAHRRTSPSARSTPCARQVPVHEIQTVMDRPRARSPRHPRCRCPPSSCQHVAQGHLEHRQHHSNWMLVACMRVDPVTAIGPVVS